ncbi:MAG: hypothetical protein ACRDZR_04825 [Acidimicrobiales bacterium]
MKVNPKQIAASAAGAVVAAVVASVFGAKGTLVGIALGSVVATTATALVVQSLERTHEAVRQAVHDPDRTQLLRRPGSSRPAGTVTGRAEDTALTEGTGAETAATGAARPGAPARPGGDGTRASAGGASIGRWRIRWPVLAASVLAVFVVALGVVTGIELLAGKPLSSVFGSGNANSGTSLGNVVSPPSTTTSTTTTTQPTASTTAPSTTTSTTSTTASPGSTTTSAPASATTTTGAGGASTTTTTTTTTSTTQPAVRSSAPSTTGTTAPGG